MMNTTALLPPLLWQQIWLSLGWSVVIGALLGWVLARRVQSGRLTCFAAAVLAAWVALPGVWGGHYWLGLAFQAPSLVTVLLSGVWIARQLSAPFDAACVNASKPQRSIFFLGLGVAGGWILLLDTLGVFATSMYQWGFGTLAPAVALLILAMPWALGGRRGLDGGSLVAVSAVALFAVLQLPTGNLFDALLDPLLWVLLHLALIQALRRQT
jgi:hypothetical protein